MIRWAPHTVLPHERDPRENACVEQLTTHDMMCMVVAIRTEGVLVSDAGTEEPTSRTLRARILSRR